MLVDELDGAHVHPTRRLRRDEQARLALEFPRQQEFLLIPARKPAGGQRLMVGADGIGFPRLVRPGVERVQSQPAPVAEGRGALQPQEKVLRHRPLGQQPLAQAVLGDHGHAQVADFARRPVGHVLIENLNLAARAAPGLAGVKDGLQQFRLPVSLHAGNADDFPVRDMEADFGEPARRAIQTVEGQAADRERPRRGGLGLGHIESERHVAAHHHFRQRLRAGARGRYLSGDLAPAKDRHPVGKIHDFPELVRDEQHRLAFRPQGLEVGEKRFGLLRGQHSRRLIQDQDLRFAEEELENFDALLDAHRQFFHRPVPIHRQPVVLGECLQGDPGASAVQPAPAMRFGAHQHVIQGRAGARQHEVLMHHADARGNRFGRRTPGPPLAVHKDFARVRGQ